MAEAETGLNPISQRFRPYPLYKDSGIQWLGKIPAHWETDRLKYIVTVSKERSYDQASDFPYIGLEHIEPGSGKLLTPVENGNDEIGEIESSSAHFRAGDILFGKLRPYLAKVFKADFEGRCSTELLVLRCGVNIYNQNLSYQLLSSGFISWINSMTYGTKMPRANAEQILDTRIPLAPLLEQQAIEEFLDRETAEIDALIAKKERLIELLQEKRTALVTQAVTKGLDPNVPMKDSGVEWLGKIPADWKVNRLKRLSSVNDETLSEKTDSRFELIYVDIGGVDQYQGIVESEEFIFETAPSRARRIVRNGDVIISTVRTYLRAIASIKHPESNLIVSTGFAVIRPLSYMDCSFAPYALRASHFVEKIVANSVGVSYPAIDASKMSCFHLAIPNIQEQHEIAAYLDCETAKIDVLVAKIHGAIDRLKEYRAALISAAVTGKIDVRVMQSTA